MALSVSRIVVSVLFITMLVLLQLHISSEETTLEKHIDNKLKEANNIIFFLEHYKEELQKYLDEISQKKFIEYFYGMARQVRPEFKSHIHCIDFDNNDKVEIEIVSNKAMFDSEFAIKKHSNVLCYENDNVKVFVRLRSLKYSVTIKQCFEIFDTFVNLIEVDGVIIREAEEEYENRVYNSNATLYALERLYVINSLRSYTCIKTDNMAESLKKHKKLPYDYDTILQFYVRHYGEAMEVEFDEQYVKRKAYINNCLICFLVSDIFSNIANGSNVHENINSKESYIDILRNSNGKIKQNGTFGMYTDISRDFFISYDILRELVYETDNIIGIEGRIYKAYENTIKAFNMEFFSCEENPSDKKEPLKDMQNFFKSEVWNSKGGLYLQNIHAALLMSDNLVILERYVLYLSFLGGFSILKLFTELSYLYICFTIVTEEKKTHSRQDIIKESIEQSEWFLNKFIEDIQYNQGNITICGITIIHEEERYFNHGWKNEKYMSLLSTAVEYNYSDIYKIQGDMADSVFFTGLNSDCDLNGITVQYPNLSEIYLIKALEIVYYAECESDVLKESLLEGKHSRYITPISIFLESCFGVSDENAKFMWEMLEYFNCTTFGEINCFLHEYLNYDIKILSCYLFINKLLNDKKIAPSDDFKRKIDESIGSESINDQEKILRFMEFFESNYEEFFAFLNTKQDIDNMRLAKKYADAMIENIM